MEIDQLTFVLSCRLLGRQGILSLCDSKDLYGRLSISARRLGLGGNRYIRDLVRNISINFGVHFV